MFGRSKDASVFKGLIGVVVFVVTWSLFIVNVFVHVAIVGWAFGIGVAGVFLKFAGFAYLAGIPVSISVMLALRNKRRYLDEQRRKLGRQSAFSGGESRGFTSAISNVFGVLLWPFSWVILFERREDVSELLSQWFNL
ncbi:MAG TPA: hypothetical protein VN420_05740 [Candidatus Fimivivens sp.]|nr:hypothetical protein [Candidatus Fimivivens sp.]